LIQPTNICAGRLQDLNGEHRPRKCPHPGSPSTPLSEALPANAPVNAPVRPPASRQHRKPASKVRTRARGRTAKGNDKGTRRPQRTDSEEASEAPREDAREQSGEEALPHRRAPLLFRLRRCCRQRHRFHLAASRHGTGPSTSTPQRLRLVDRASRTHGGGLAGTRGKAEDENA
jgi:hypothetical protein